MSDLVPCDIQIEIIKKLPIRSLIRFRSVSKAWKSLIDSSKFIHNNCQHDNQPHHLLVSYYRKYVSIMDDDSFPQNKFYLTVPVTLNRPGYVIKVGCSNGIICLLSIDIDFNTEMAVLWNPTIRKSVDIAIPNVLYMPHGYTVFGFAVCPNTNDPKLVKITLINKSGSEIMNCVSWEAEMFTLSSGDWRSLPIAMPSKHTELFSGQVFINGVIYWCANDWVDAGRENKHNRIISFDLRIEEFGEVFLSDSLVRSTRNLHVSKLMDSLVVIERYFEAGNLVCAVWKMNQNVLKSFTKLYTVKASDGAIFNNVLEFWKNGEPIMETLDESGSLILEVYDPCAKHVRDLKLDGNKDSFTSCFVSSYTETLALLRQSDSIIH